MGLVFPNCLFSQEKCGSRRQILGDLISGEMETRTKPGPWVWLPLF